jgi:hypothetical protein
MPRQSFRSAVKLAIAMIGLATMTAASAGPYKGGSPEDDIQMLGIVGRWRVTRLRDAFRRLSLSAEPSANPLSKTDAGTPAVRSMRLLSICAIVVTLSTSSSAIAETAEERAACINDAFRFCLDAIPDRGRVYNCLVANKTLISAPCRALVEPGISTSQITETK